MSEFPNRFDTPEDAYRGFFRADNAKNPEAWAAVMSYPHVRVSATGRTAYFDTPAQYAAGANWAPREATGWVRSVGVDPVRRHESADKVHLLGGWTRYNAAGEPILANRVTYVLTKPKDSWGIQARFGVDSFAGQDDAAATSAAVDLVQRYADALGAGDFDRCMALCRLPLILVGVGQVSRIADAAALRTRLGRQPEREVANREFHAVQAGTDGAVVALTIDYAVGDSDQAIAIVGRQRCRWEIAGISRIGG